MSLNLENISIAIGKKIIVKHVTLQTSQNQFVGVIGANGSGKSTMLKSVYKSLKPSDGSIYIDDLDLLKASERQVSQKLGVVGQFNEVSFDLSVEQMVLLGRTPHKKLMESDNPEDLAIVEEALVKTGLATYRNRSFLSLSGGEKQRVILARAIAQQPSYLILDEPTNHLDIHYQLEIMETVKQLHIGVLAALHDLDLAVQYCDYIYAMKDGRLIAQGEPEAILTKELIETIYQVKCTLFHNPVTGRLGFAFHL